MIVTAHGKIAPLNGISHKRATPAFKRGANTAQFPNHASATEYITLFLESIYIPDTPGTNSRRQKNRVIERIGNGSQGSERSR